VHDSAGAFIVCRFWQKEATNKKGTTYNRD